MFLANLPLPSLSEIMFYTYGILNLTRAGAVFSKSLLITVVFNENYKNLNPKLTCYSIIGVLGFSFESKTLRLLPVGVHVRLGWVALSLCGSKEEIKNTMENIILTWGNLWILWLTEKVQSLYGLIFELADEAYGGTVRTGWHERSLWYCVILYGSNTSITFISAPNPWVLPAISFC